MDKKAVRIIFSANEDDLILRSENEILIDASNGLFYLRDATEVSVLSIFPQEEVLAIHYLAMDSQPE